MSTTPSSSAAAPPFKRPPRGHKQKGAGTTVVSKGDVKRDGLEIKEWQKTPKQLLSEYCKAEKRPPPRYVPSSILGKSTGILLRVCERDTTFAQRKQGYGLTMQQGAIALARLGIPVIGTSSLAHVSFLPDGTVLGCYGREMDDRVVLHGGEESTLQFSHKTRHNIQLPRQRLRALLMRDIHPPSWIHWNAKLESYSLLDNGGVRVKFEGSQSIVAGCLVGCDGIFSAVAKQKFGHTQELAYLGMIVMLGICKADHLPSLHRRVTQTLDGETRIFTMPFTSEFDQPEDEEEWFVSSKFPSRTNVLMWQLSFTCPEHVANELGRKGGAALKEEALKRCGTWHQPIPQLLLDTDPEDITGYPTYDRDALAFDATQKDCVTVLGDAAHCMSPFKGQGANQALVDAVSLSRHLSQVFGVFKTDEKSTSQVLREFEQEMMERAGEKVLLSRKAAAFLHSQDALVVGNCVRSAASFERRLKKTASWLEEESKQRSMAKHLFEQ
jgi:2-polyprenyl-6-methoxyphenol hydroxylase-like FAD-dependent oxidoreductase